MHRTGKPKGGNDDIKWHHLKPLRQLKKPFHNSFIPPCTIYTKKVQAKSSLHSSNCKIPSSQSKNINKNTKASHLHYYHHIIVVVRLRTMFLESSLIFMSFHILQHREFFITTYLTLIPNRLCSLTNRAILETEPALFQNKQSKTLLWFPWL